MPKSYKAPNKRIIHRKGNGRFRATTIEEGLASVGIDHGQISAGKETCERCHQVFMPLLKHPLCFDCRDLVAASSDIHLHIEATQGWRFPGQYNQHVLLTCVDSTGEAVVMATGPAEDQASHEFARELAAILEQGDVAFGTNPFAGDPRRGILLNDVISGTTLVAQATFNTNGFLELIKVAMNHPEFKVLCAKHCRQTPA